MNTRALLGGWIVLAIVTACLLWVGQPRAAWSVLLAGTWCFVNAWTIGGLCALAVRWHERRSWLRLLGQLAVKFPLLYGVGYVALVALQPSAAGLTAGWTIALAALVWASVIPASAAHG